MNGQPQPIELPVIHEHDFRSQMPVIGSLVRLVRSALYRLTAKWGVLSVIHQQNQINQDIAHYLREHEERLREYDARIIEQDRDLAYLSRAIAELEVRQRHLVELVRSQSDAAPQAPLVSSAVE
jgi:hypothetical protein